MSLAGKGRAALTLFAAATAMAGALAVSPVANAAGGSCSGAGPTTPSGKPTVYCDTYVTTDVRQGTTPYDWDGRSIGTLYAGRNWVVCQTQGVDNPVIQGAHNNWWLYTLADVAKQGYTGWGYIPATAVVQGGEWQPVPGVPSC